MDSRTAEMSTPHEPSDVDLPSRLRRRLSAALPGRRAQQLLEPDAAYGRHFGPPSFDARAAAVMVLLYPRDFAWHFALTVRHAELATHAGQTSLPGGLVESGETGCQAAERELEEEIGVTARDISVLGSLSPLFLFSTHFFVTPWVAAAEREPAFRPQADEVAELLQVPLVDLFDRQNIGRHRLPVRGIPCSVPHWKLVGREVWGVTAMILAEFAAVCRDVQVE